MTWEMCRITIFRKWGRKLRLMRRGLRNFRDSREEMIRIIISTWTLMLLNQFPCQEVAFSKLQKPQFQFDKAKTTHLDHHHKNIETKNVVRHLPLIRVKETFNFLNKASVIRICRLLRIHQALLVNLSSSSSKDSKFKSFSHSSSNLGNSLLSNKLNHKSTLTNLSTNNQPNLHLTNPSKFIKSCLRNSNSSLVKRTRIIKPFRLK